MRRASQVCSRQPCRAGPPHPAVRNGRRPRRGFTLIEALFAATILTMSVIATSMALSSGHQYGQESEERVQATLAAEALLAEILTLDYAVLPAFDGHEEPPGALVTTKGLAYPESYYRLGRRATVVSKLYSFPDLGLGIQGLEITVQGYNLEGRVLAQLVRFVPEPGA